MVSEVIGVKAVFSRISEFAFTGNGSNVYALKGALRRQ